MVGIEGERQDREGLKGEFSALALTFRFTVPHKIALLN
jgi:hypothetical protein